MSVQLQACKYKVQRIKYEVYVEVDARVGPAALPDVRKWDGAVSTVAGRSVAPRRRSWALSSCVWLSAAPSAPGATSLRDGGDTYPAP